MTASFELEDDVLAAVLGWLASSHLRVAERVCRLWRVTTAGYKLWGAVCARVKGLPPEVTCKASLMRHFVSRMGTRTKSLTDRMIKQGHVALSKKRRPQPRIARLAEVVKALELQCTALHFDGQHSEQLAPGAGRLLVGHAAVHIACTPKLRVRMADKSVLGVSLLSAALGITVQHIVAGPCWNTVPAGDAQVARWL